MNRPKLYLSHIKHNVSIANLTIFSYKTSPHLRKRRQKATQITHRIKANIKRAEKHILPKTST